MKVQGWLVGNSGEASIRTPTAGAGLCVFVAGLVAAVLVPAGHTAWAWNPAAGDFSKVDPADVRIVSYNTYLQFIKEPSKDAAFARVLTALDPDIICFQEIVSSLTAGQIVSRLQSVLPFSEGTWQVHLGLSSGSRVVLASRYPLDLRRTDTVPAAGIRGVTIALADLPDEHYRADLYLLGVHLKAGGTSSDQANRQRSADAIAAWLGMVRQPGGLVTLAANTPMVVLGDFNLVTGPQPAITLLTGDIQDEATYGPDVKGDWDSSDMTDLTPVDPFTSNENTWRSDRTNPADRLDRFMYTDSVAPIAARMVLNTRNMTTAALAASGLQEDDTTPTNTADHLPILMDLVVPTWPDCNHNGVNDALDISGGTSQDCNSSGIPDECELEDNDCNSSGIPDECELDNDGDGKIDDCDNCPFVYNPNQTDTNGDGIGDACERPSVVGAVSRRTHGSSGSYDVDVRTGTGGHPDAIESRAGSSVRLVVTFDQPIQGVGGLDPTDVIVTSGSVAGVAIQGNELTIDVVGVVSGDMFAVAFAGIESTYVANQTVLDTLCFSVLQGDVNGDGMVNIFDLVHVRNTLNQPVATGNFRADVNADGSVNIFDLVAVRNRLNSSVAITCP
ncbi:MAG: hypothetical protein GXY55_14945 [Phycisphaerae bacterium]|nr:hypothetical protein [Phycisphaerae bacterium]